MIEGKLGAVNHAKCSRVREVYFPGLGRFTARFCESRIVYMRCIYTGTGIQYR